MKLYRVKLNNGGYISGSSIQTTKCKWQALTCKEKAKRDLNLADGAGTIEQVTIHCNRPCLVGDLEFGMGDTYSFKNVNGFIIHETNKFVWTIQVDVEGFFVNGSVQKHKKSDEGTKSFRTGKGYKEIQEPEVLEGKATLKSGTEVKISVSRSFNGSVLIEAVMPKGRDLACTHSGILRSRLESDRAIGTVLMAVTEFLESYEGVLLDEGEETVVNGRINSRCLYINDNVVHLENLKSLESGQCVSWHYHDVFKDRADIKVTVKFCEGMVQYFARDEDLYSMDKIRTLVDSYDFKNEKYSFFFYEEVKRLASGLLSEGETL